MLLERFGVPPIFLFYKPGMMNATQQGELRNVLANMQAATAGMIPRNSAEELEPWSPELAEQTSRVFIPAIDMFNQIAGDEMQIELFVANQLVPTEELFRAMQRGTIDAVQSDDDSMASPTEVTVFGGYFPFASSWIALSTLVMCG